MNGDLAPGGNPPGEKGRPRCGQRRATSRSEEGPRRALDGGRCLRIAKRGSLHGGSLETISAPCEAARLSGAERLERGDRSIRGRSSVVSQEDNAWLAAQTAAEAEHRIVKVRRSPDRARPGRELRCVGARHRQCGIGRSRSDASSIAGNGGSQALPFTSRSSSKDEARGLYAPAPRTERTGARSRMRMARQKGLRFGLGRGW